MVGWMRWLDDISLTKLLDIVKNRAVWSVTPHGVAKSWT